MLYTVEVENELGEIVDMITTRMWLIAVINEELLLGILYQRMKIIHRRMC